MPPSRLLTYGVEVSIGDWPADPVVEKVAYRTGWVKDGFAERLLKTYVRTAGNAWTAVRESPATR